MALAALLLATGAAPAGPSLVDGLAAQDPERLVAQLVALGKTIDLADRNQVRAAIGRVEGLPVRGDINARFVGYSTPQGEIIYNADLGSTVVLLLAPKTCLPRAVLQRHLDGPEFRLTPKRITVALYDFAQYSDRPGMALTWIYGQPCIGSFGLQQATAPA